MGPTSDGAVLAGRYRLLRVIGSGGMAVVWRSFDELLQREVAVKLMAERIADDPVLRERFEREARHAASQAHPNIVAVHDFGLHDGRAFIVMELVPGPSLRRVLEVHRTLSVAATTCVAMDTLAALDHAHRNGLVHRDLKPGNILLSPGGVAKLADFGIAKSLDDSTELTNDGSFLGTATYASPEQLAGGEVGPHADLYSLSCVLYRCLVGSPPFSSDDLARLVMQQRFADPPPIAELRPDVPEAVAYALMRSLDKDPDRRCPTAREMRALFAPFAGDEAERLQLAALAESVTTTAGEDASTGRDHGDERSPTPPMGQRATRREIHRREGVHRLTVGALVTVVVLAIVAALVVILLGGGTHPQTGASSISAGDRLLPGQRLESPNSRYQLVMDRDGNLVSSQGRGAGVPTWESGTAGHPGAYAVMQSDGNLVLYPPGGSAPQAGQPSAALWFTGTGGHPGATLRLQNDGNLVVYGTDHQSLWESGAVAGSVGSQLLPGMTLHPSQYLRSPNGRFHLRNRGNLGGLELVAAAAPSCVLWSTPPTVDRPASVASMGSDGNLALYPPGGAAATWDTGTSGNPGAILVLEDSGALVVSSPSAFTLWQAPPRFSGACASTR